MHRTAPGAAQGDDDWISIVARTDAEWRALCDLVPGLSGLAALDLGQRMDAERVIDAALTAWAGTRPASAAAESLLEGRHSRGRPRALRGSGEKPASCRPRILGQARCRRAAGIALARKFRPHDRPRAGTGRGLRSCARRRPWAVTGTYCRTADERSAWLERGLTSPSPGTVGFLQLTNSKYGCIVVHYFALMDRKSYARANRRARDQDRANFVEAGRPFDAPLEL